MKTLNLAAAAFAAGILAASPALAEPFQGPFVGIQAGANRDSAGTIATDRGRAAVDDHRVSFTGGIYAGYDYKLTPRVVVGAEVGGNLTTGDTLDGGAPGQPVSIDPKRQIDLTARVGYLVTPKQLVYVRGGYTNVRVERSIGQTAALSTSSTNLDGWTLGAGTERYLLDNVSARVEYRYSDLSQGHGRYDRQQALFGVSYHF